MNINWKIRFKNPQFIIGFVSQLLIIAQMVTVGLNEVGAINWQWTEQINTWVLAFVNAVLVLLASMSIVQDPTTKSYSDSEQAKSYTEPK
jgi:phi LC3 family holin